MSKIAGSGWVPAALVALVGAFLAHHAGGVALVDIVLFGGYVAGYLVLPGTLVWRWVTVRRGDRPLAEDLAIGALVGYVIEFPAYLFCLVVGHPHAYVVWPALVVIASLVVPSGRDAWRRRRQTMPLRWSWSVSALLAYSLYTWTRLVWTPSPVTPDSLRRPYFDEPFHLSLISSLRHYFPPKILYVDDTPLQYHWLGHLHMAAASWVTGIEPIVLLRGLAIPMVLVLAALATAHAARRLTGSDWPGIVLLVGLVAIVPATFSGWSDIGGEPLLASRWVGSPSAGFVNAALVVVLLLVVELLKRDLTGVRPWLLTALAMLAMFGAKSTSLPTVMAGLIVSAAVTALVTRKLDRANTGLAALAVGVFVVGTPLFYGGGTHGLAPDLFALNSEAGRLDRPAAALASLAYLGLMSVGGAGLLALMSARGYRRPDHVFLVFVVLSGIGAAFTFHQQGSSEYYFLFVVLLPMLLGGVLGIHHVTQRLPGGAARWTGSVAFAGAAALTCVLLLLTRTTERADMTGGQYRVVLLYYVLPVLAVLAITLAVAVLTARVAGRRFGLPTRRGPLLLAIVLAASGAGAAPTVVDRVPSYVAEPLGDDTPRYPVTIGPGGITAARWLRDHTTTDVKVATNAHCQVPKMETCWARNFWLAGYSERQFLVEGWSYVARSTVDAESMSGKEDLIAGPFWDPERLADNDAAFENPDPGTLDRLRNHYGVRWLVVDLAYPADTKALNKLADRRFADGLYVVYRLR